MEPQTGTHQSIKYVGWCRCAGEPWATESWFKGHWRTAHKLNPFSNSLNVRASTYTYYNADRARARDERDIRYPLRSILHSLYSIPQVAMLGGMGLYYQLFPAWSGDTEGACALSADSACCNLQVLLDDHPDHPAWEQKTCLYLKHVVCCLQLKAGPLLCPFIRYIRRIIRFVEEFLMPSRSFKFQWSLLSKRPLGPWKRLR